MDNVRVCILYFPWLYADIIQRLIQRLDRVKVVDSCRYGLHPHFRCAAPGLDPDVVILSLDRHAALSKTVLPLRMPGALVIAFSSRGGYGLRRLPGANHWEVIQPFGVAQLLQMVQRAPDQGDQQSFPASHSS